ncbi:unnamed protein product [Linum trigynum]|uniref:Uncharacterized protein n=1 Tax=Linum trigynum TaxID=586398 RepID=A0AAV2EDT2_9ROSI
MGHEGVTRTTVSSPSPSFTPPSIPDSASPAILPPAVRTASATCLLRQPHRPSSMPALASPSAISASPRLAALAR